MRPDLLEVLRAGAALHVDHYGGHRLPYACLGASGLVQRMVALDGPSAGEEREVLDASGGYASACLGAGHPAMAAAAQHAVASSSYVTDEVGSLERAELLAELLGPGGAWVDRFPAGAYHACGRNSGSEGMELALRLVLEDRFELQRVAPRPGRERRTRVLAFEGAWHGWTAGVASLLNRRHFRIGLPEWSGAAPYGLEVVHLPFGDAEALAEVFARDGDTFAAAIVEPIQGDAGILLPPPGYLRQLATLCREHGARLVADEVLTFAKSGAWFAMSDEGGPIPTDVTVIGKSLGMGMISTAMVIARRELSVRPSGAVATSDLRPFTCRVMRAGLRVISEQRLIERSAELGPELGGALGEVARGAPEVFQAARGRGYLHGLELTEAAAAHLDALRRSLFDAGVHVEFMAGAGRRSRRHRYLFPALRVAPPLVAEKVDLVQIAERIAKAADRFRRGVLR